MSKPEGIRLISSALEKHTIINSNPRTAAGPPGFLMILNCLSIHSPVLPAAKQVG
jgi:hypothetical protein